MTSLYYGRVLEVRIAPVKCATGVRLRLYLMQAAVYILIFWRNTYETKVY